MKLSSVYEWVRLHRVAFDIWLVAFPLWLFTTVAAVIAAAQGPGPAEAVLWLFIGTAQTLPVGWLRPRPTAVFTVVSLACLVQLVAVDTPLPSSVGFLFALYGLAAHGRSTRLRVAGLLVGVLAALLAIVDWFPQQSLLGYALSFTLLGGVAVVTWIGGDLVHHRQHVLNRLEEQNEALHRDQEQRAELAAQHERTRIAREMHDIVAHSLSVVVVQADGGAYAAEHGSSWDRTQAVSTLGTIGTTAREALTETRRLVGVLRSGDGDADWAPTATLADIEDLASGVRQAGHAVTVEVSAPEGELPRDVELAAYRIVQEALTNVLKHAGPRASVDVMVGGEDVLNVQVADDGRGSSAAGDGAGNGIIGMRERAAAVGGNVTTGPRPGGGFLVNARLPTREAT